MNKRNLALTVVLCVLAFVSPNLAQRPSVIQGKVVNDDGSLPGVWVTLVRDEAESTDRKRTQTDADGRYVFTDITPGNYLLTASWDGLNRTVSRKVNIAPSATKVFVPDIVLSEQPCLDEGGSLPEVEPSEAIRAEIVPRLIDLKFGTSRPSPKKPIFVLNDLMKGWVIDVKAEWLSSEQRSRLSFMTRAQVQAEAEKLGSQGYYSVSKMKMRGNCVGVSMLEDVAIKGQTEDANMAGGGSAYEFRRVGGDWVGQLLISWIS